MSLITWSTPAGDLGTYPSLNALSVQLWADSDDPNSTVKYKLQSGNFPKSVITDPISVSSSGVLTGKLGIVTSPVTSTFTIRAYDQYGAIRDRTFSITAVNNTIPSLTTPSGLLMTVVDSVYVNFQLAYTNPVVENTVSITVSSGTLPPGLRMNSSGLITGYPLPPESFNGAPTTKTYSFSVQLITALGNSTSSYSITVYNHQLTNGSNTRIPAILNSKPITLPVPASDVYYDYYLGTDNIIPTIRANEYFSFKVIGNDFDNNDLTYAFSNLPAGLSGDTDTGWITGTVSMTTVGINNYQFNARVLKTTFPSVTSSTLTFYLTVSNQLSNDIVWVTDSELGPIDNGMISELYVSATSRNTLVYSLIEGSLPPNLTLTETGEIVGRVPFQPIGQLLAQGAQSEFIFTVVAYATEFPLLKQTRQFTLKVNQTYATPYENIYIKASPSIENRQILSSLLLDNSLIPDSYLYRPSDPYFGKASDIRFVHIYGMKPATLTDYITAVQRNHYTRQLVLGNIKTARATDSQGNVIYEVVYSEIMDDLLTSSGSSISSTVKWPKPITLPDDTTISQVYPASLTTMRDEILSKIPNNSMTSLLPKWMTSQQSDGNTTGFIKGWVICYTLPGKAEIIKSNIENNWDYAMNSIEFSIDRYVVDRSATYDWNLEFQTPSWNELPSATPAPESIDDKNLSILFPQKSIIPTLGQ